MCLIAVANRCIPGIRTLIAANRDEFFARPTAAAHLWPQGLVGGQDLQALGAWMLLRPGGGFAALTNIRKPKYMQPHAGPSRGELVVQGALAASASDFASGISRQAYSGFNLLVEDGEALWVVGSDTAPQAIAPGVHGLSNAVLDSPWPKSLALCEAVQTHGLDPDALFSALENPARYSDDVLPNTGVPLALERGLSAAFVALDGYGTRASTVAWIRDDGHWGFIERRHGDGETRLGLAMR
ncbi:MAG: hypothetical protein GWP91_16645 [Rhodobacterales bacterium]|nr:hypothetical protein [Rhodobacterales bacterium]